MAKTRVDIERLRELQAELDRINALVLEDIEWYENGQPANVKPEAVKQFAFIGLRNTNFIEFIDPETGLLNVVTEPENEEEES